MSYADKSDALPGDAGKVKHTCPVCAAADMSLERLRLLARQFRELANKMHDAASIEFKGGATPPPSAQRAADALLVEVALMDYLSLRDPDFPKFITALNLISESESEKKGSSL